MDFFTSFASLAAQTDGAAPIPGLGGFDMQSIFPILLIVGMFVVLYFLMIRPQRKQQKELEKKISGLEKGDSVIIQGGIYGEYAGDENDGKTAFVKISDDTKIRVVKRMILHVVKKGDKVTGEELKDQQ